MLLLNRSGIRVVRLNREPDSHHGPLARRGFHIDGSLMEIDRTHRERQSEAISSLFGREVEVKNLIQVLGGNASAFVLKKKGKQTITVTDTANSALTATDSIDVT